MSRGGAPDRGRVFSRREFLLLSAAGAAGFCAGCATNPISGRNQLMFYSEADELKWDKEYSPHQTSADYGAVGDPKLSAYLADIGSRLVAVSHRPGMPYAFRGVNASYINAYAFPGGSIAATRGILLMMENEAQLASLLGHEIAHVCARHTASRMTKGLVLTGVLYGAVLLAELKDEDLTPWVAGLGYIGSGMLLCKYSREDEREADRYGMVYAVQAGFNPDGEAGLMDGFIKLSERRPNLLERLFSTHPMSQERYDTAVKTAQTEFAEARGRSLDRERYMDMTAVVRRAKPVIEAIQKGDDEVYEERWDRAQFFYGDALRAGPNDYEALLKLANCRLVRDQPREALPLIKQAQAVFPTEPQALHLEGLAHVMTGSFDQALASFTKYEAALPGNPFTLFHIGRSQEGLGRRDEAADRYRRFLDAGGEGKEADHARRRLAQWGFTS